MIPLHEIHRTELTAKVLHIYLTKNLCEVLIMDNGISKIPTDRSDEVLTELYFGTLMSENSTDHIIPEYIPDTEKILLCTASPRIDGKYFNGGSLEIEGTVYFSLLLSGEGGTVSELSFSEQFSAEAAIDGLEDNCTVSIVPSVNYVTARLINQRKLGIRYQIDSDIKVFCPSSITLSVEGAESVSDETGICKQSITATSADIAIFEEREIAVSEDVELDGSFQQIGEIVLCRVRLNPTEIREGDGIADIRTEAIVNCIYRSDNGECISADKKFTLEHRMTCPTDGGREWTAIAVPSPVEARVTPNSYGEMKVIELDLTYDLSLKGIKNRDIELVSDVYSTDYEADTALGEKSIAVFGRCFVCGLSLNASAKKNEIGAEDTVSVLTGAVNIKDTTVHCDREKRKLIIEGTAEISAVCSSGEYGSGYSRAAFNSHFRCETDAPETLPSDRFIINCFAGDTKFRADQESIYCDTELSLRVTALGTKQVNYISSIRLKHDEPAVHADSPITLYYPTDGESLFDIAKHYRITDRSIMTANSMTDHSTIGRRVLVIPRMETAQQC